MIDKSELLLHAAALDVSVVMSAPDTFHAKLLKCIVQHLTRRLRNQPLPPKGLADPIAKLIFVIFFCKVVAMKADTADGLTVFLQTNGKNIRSRQHRTDNITAVLNTCVRRPSCGQTHFGICGICIQIFCIILAPWAKNETFRL